MKPMGSLPTIIVFSLLFNTPTTGLLYNKIII